MMALALFTEKEKQISAAVLLISGLLIYLFFSLSQQHQANFQNRVCLSAFELLSEVLQVAVYEPAIEGGGSFLFILSGVFHSP